MIYTDEETFVCVDDKVAAKFGNFQTPLNGFSIGIDVFKKVDKFCKLTPKRFQVLNAFYPKYATKVGS